jgi:RNA polymerase sigma-70 factor (ECF subfamily)
MLTDAQLLALVVRGENWALSEIHARYIRLVFSHAVKILNYRASADEIAQQVFTKVWRSAGDYRADRGKFSTWVRSITLHECIDELRRRRMRPVTEPCDEERLYKAASDNDPVQHTFERARIREALQQIPAEQRIVIELAFWGGLTQQEIAVYCQSPLGTIKTRWRLAMQRLRRLLQESD